MVQIYEQRSDLTFKHNMSMGRHGWLRLTPAYSIKIVDAILTNHDKGISVLDPFSGTATTTLCSVMRGYEAVSVDINPFLVWLGNLKVGLYTKACIGKTYKIGKELSEKVFSNSIQPSLPPNIYNLSRWWEKQDIDYLCTIKSGIETMTPKGSEIRDLLNVAFCRTVIKLSNAAFNHQSLSFKKKDADSTQLKLWDYVDETRNYFFDDLNYVLNSAKENPAREGKVLEGDARKLNEILEKKFDLLVTSPPYPNRISYIRELRPYMYWLGFIKDGREAGELDWETIGGTWGIATSRLTFWEKEKDIYFPRNLETILSAIASVSSKSGVVLSKYVAKYFSDMWKHFIILPSILSRGAKVHYIVGNSKFYDVTVPVEEIIADMLAEIGFQRIETRIIRKRNSKKELFEYDISGYWVA
jgi:hypothetical protein